MTRDVAIDCERALSASVFELLVVTPPGTRDPSLAVAAARAGEVGLHDLTHRCDARQAVADVERLQTLASGSWGLLLHGRMAAFEQAVLAAAQAPDLVLLTPEPGVDLAPVVAHWREVAERVGIVVTGLGDAERAQGLAIDLIVAKGHEAGGRVGEETTFILLQRLLRMSGIPPVFAWGGVGHHTAAACRVAGAAGVVVDWQLSLTPEAGLPTRFRRRIEAMDGSETATVRDPRGGYLRLYHQPGMSAKDRLEAASRRLASDASDPARVQAALAEWESLVASLLIARRVEDRLWLVSQDAAHASHWSETTGSLARICTELRDYVDLNVRGAAESAALRRGGPLARSHGTEFPAVQGPMTRVSDVPEFCDAVERGGALPFVALAVMRRPEVERLLRGTRDLMGERPWGVGVLGFVQRELRAEQLAVIEAIRPPFVLIAGGRADQAAHLESQGIRTYLHAPAPGILEMFLREGARRFIFEGRDCGGHVGPRTSFVLWETMIRVLLDAELSEEQAAGIHVLFAGGVCDAMGAAMVAAMAEPLVRRGMKIGVLMGTAYLFTDEAVQTGAIVPAFQETAVRSRETVLVETGPGHAIRCAPTEYTRIFDGEKARLSAEGRSAEEIREELEQVNMGRLRIASKGITRPAESAEGAGSFVELDRAAQLKEGMYMLGQVAALCERIVSISELHASVFDGGVAWLDALVSRLEPVVVARSSKPAPARLDVAIVGMSCMLPGSPDVQQFWENVLEKRDLIEEIPPDRFQAERWFDAAGGRDKVVGKWGGFLKDIRFDPLKYGIPPNSLHSIEPAQLLALELVDRALRDAGRGGVGEADPSKERTSVILGAGGGLAELGSQYVLRSLAPQYIDNLNESLLDQLPEWTEDSFAGILMNVIAGRVANRFDLGGLNFTVDAACASSLAALYLGCRELADGTSDLVIAGGCDTVQNPFAYLCFSSAGALSPSGRCRPFDAKGDGIVISEGLAAVVLKRLDDAERDGDRIYAVVRGVAGGSDGRSKGMTAPRLEGQLRTLERAYAQARFSPATVGLFEAHGTGTKLGDQTECQSVGTLLDQHGVRPGSIPIGSVKSNIGHTKCAAGVAGLIKIALALHHKTLPPTLHVSVPNPRCGFGNGPLYPISERRPWIRGEHPRRAAVSGFGFGGTNFHAVLEAYEGGALSQRLETSRRNWPSELFVFADASASGVASQVKRFASEVQAVRSAGVALNLGDLAYTRHLQMRSSGAALQAAVVAKDVDELLVQLAGLARACEADGELAGKGLPANVFCAAKRLGDAASLAFLFPGQGSQFPEMMLDLALEFAEVREAFELADAVLRKSVEGELSKLVFPPPSFSPDDRARAADALKETNVAQPALGASSVGMLRLLSSFGIEPQLAAGHSYGELVALHAAGCIDERTLYTLSRARGDAMVAIRGEGGAADLGTMLAVQSDERSLRDQLEGCAEVWIANLNSPTQTVISGTRAGIDGAKRRLDELGVACVSIPVGCAFHSPIMEPARKRFEGSLAETPFEPPAIPVYSNRTAEAYPGGVASIRELLSEQLVRPVRFAEEVERMYEAGARVFVEVGPGEVLTKLVDRILGSRPHLAVVTHRKGSDAVTQLQTVLAQLFGHGVSLDLDRLYEGRDLCSLDLRKLAAGPAPQPPHVWLVNGAYARPSRKEPRVLGPKASLAGPSQAPAIAAPSGAAPVEAGRNDPLAEFQQTMRLFLETQQAVMQLHLQPGGSEASLPVWTEATPAVAIVAPPEPVVVDIPRHLEPAPAVDLEQQLVAIVSNRTGYPPDMLTADANLEADLGIDSIKRVEIIAAFRRAVLPSLENPPSWFMEQMTAAKTIRGIVDGVRQLIDGGELPKPVPAPSASAPADRVPTRLDPAPETAERCVPVSVETPLDEPGVLPAGAVVLTDDGAGLARALQARLESGGNRTVILESNALADRDRAVLALEHVRASCGRIAAAIHLLPTRNAPSFPEITPEEWRRHAEIEVRGALHLLQALSPELSTNQTAPFFFCAVTTGAGDFDAASTHECLSPWRGGLAGLLKSAALEWKEARFRAIDLDTPIEAVAAEQLIREWTSAGPVEVGYRAGRRLTHELVRAELDPKHRDVAAPALDERSVVLVTGGARGITAEIAVEIARQAQPRLVLLGRSPLPDAEEKPETAAFTAVPELRRAVVALARASGEQVAPREIEARLRSLLAAREIRSTLKRLTEAGSRAEYIACDVRDAEDLTRVVRELEARCGEIDGVVHGAGIIDDRWLVEKTAESFDRVVGTKLDPVLTLSRILRPDRLKLFMLFSSVAGFFGNAGQGDYAAANEMLNRVSRRLRDLWPGKVVAMNWGPWAGAGMVTPEVAEQFRSRGVGLVGLEAGCRAAWNEMSTARHEPARVVIGPGPWIATADQRATSRSDLSSSALSTSHPLLAGQRIVSLPDGELQVELVLDPAKHAYLDDHRIDGAPVLAFAVALEMMAELAAAARPDWQVICVEDVRQLGGIIVEEAGRRIQLRAEPLERSAASETWKVRIADPRLTARALYEARVRLAPKLPPRPKAPRLEPLERQLASSVAEAYQERLFHGPNFQVITQLSGVGRSGIDAHVGPSNPRLCAGSCSRGGWLIDPIVLDAAPQLVIVWSRELHGTTLLPNRVGSFHRYGALGDEPVELMLRTKQCSDGSTAEMDVWFLRGGEVVGRMESLEATGNAQLNRLAGVTLR